MKIPNRWQVEDTTLRLAGGDLGDGAMLPSALSRTLSKALHNNGHDCYRWTDKTYKNNRRTTVERHVGSLATVSKPTVGEWWAEHHLGLSVYWCLAAGIRQTSV